MSDGQQRPPYQPLSIPEERKTPKCPSCNRNHWLSQCGNFKTLRLGERYKFIRAKRLCANCLTPGHFVHDCTKASFCRVPGCPKKHSTYLHEKEQRNEVKPRQPSEGNRDINAGTTTTSTPANNGYLKGDIFQVSDASSIVGLSIVPVKVKAKGQERNVSTYAFLDSGSNTSFCTKDLLKRLDVKGEKTTLLLTTMQTSNKPVECSLVNLEITDLNDHNLIELPMVYSRPSLPLTTDTIATQEDVNWWPHLKGVSIPAIDFFFNNLYFNNKVHYINTSQYCYIHYTG